MQLIERGASVAANADGETPVHVATRAGDLLRSGRRRARVTQRDTAGNIIALECLLRDTNVDVEAKSTLVSAASSRRPRVV